MLGCKEEARPRGVLQDVGDGLWKRKNVLVLDSTNLPDCQASGMEGADPFRRLAFIKYDPGLADEGDIRSAAFSVGRRNQITRLLEHRHGIACTTDDAEMWLDIALPYIVEASEILGRSCFIDGLRWAYRYTPDFVARNGGARIIDMIEGALATKSRVAAMHAGDGRGFVPWLPRVLLMRDMLRPTREEVALLDLRGWLSIDPLSDDERKRRDRDRKRAGRFAAGMKPQATRTRTRDMQRLAELLGVGASTLHRWQKSGRFGVMVERRLTSVPLGDAPEVSNLLLGLADNDVSPIPAGRCA